MARHRGGSPPVSLLEISRVLEETARLLREHARLGGENGVVVRRQDTPTATEVRAIIAARWLRREYLGFDAADPVWSMMLELYASRLEGRSVSQTWLGVAAGVPETSAVHITRRMLAEGIFTRKSDPADRRKLLIGLSDTAAKRLQDYLVATRSLVDRAP
jgi:hypothetical protein